MKVAVDVYGRSNVLRRVVLDTASLRADVISHLVRRKGKKRAPSRVESASVGFVFSQRRLDLQPSPVVTHSLAGTVGESVHETLVVVQTEVMDHQVTPSGRCSTDPGSPRSVWTGGHCRRRQNGLRGRERAQGVIDHVDRLPVFVERQVLVRRVIERAVAGAVGDDRALPHGPDDVHVAGAGLQDEAKFLGRFYRCAARPGNS